MNLKIPKGSLNPAKMSGTATPNKPIAGDQLMWKRMAALRSSPTANGSMRYSLLALSLIPTPCSIHLQNQTFNCPFTSFYNNNYYHKGRAHI